MPSAARYSGHCYSGTAEGVEHGGSFGGKLCRQTPVLFLSESFRDGGDTNEKANFLDCDD